GGGGAAARGRLRAARAECGRAGCARAKSRARRPGSQGRAPDRSPASRASRRALRASSRRRPATRRGSGGRPWRAGLSLPAVALTRDLHRLRLRSEAIRARRGVLHEDRARRCHNRAADLRKIPMNERYRRLLRGTPERHAPTAGAFATDARALRSWVAALPLANFTTTAKLLIDGLR